MPLWANLSPRPTRAACRLCDPLCGTGLVSVVLKNHLKQLGFSRTYSSFGHHGFMQSRVYLSTSPLSLTMPRMPSSFSYCRWTWWRADVGKAGSPWPKNWA